MHAPSLLAVPKQQPFMAVRREKYHYSVTKFAVAMAIGIFIGCFVSSLFPYGIISSSHTHSKSQASSCKSESSEKLSKLRLNNVKLLEKNAELAKQIKELNAKLRFVEQERDHAQEQYTTLSVNSIKNRPNQTNYASTSKALRSNPVVLSNEYVNPRLAKILAEVSINKELIVALASSKKKSMLKVWVSNIEKVGIHNYLVVAVDEGIEEFCKLRGVHVYTYFDTIAMEGGSHTVSAMKFRILREFLQLGYSVLLSDIDIVYIQNPFNHLYRDSDVEAMTDGHDNMTAYGYNDIFDDPTMGWSRNAYTRRIWVYNSGFFYIRPTTSSIELLNRVSNRLANETNVWDQAVFNEELFHPSHPGYLGIHASKRTMDFYLFMNSKVLFKTVRYDPTLAKLKPVIVHLNYHHSDKLRRMKAVVEFYVNGKHDALDLFSEASSM